MRSADAAQLETLFRAFEHISDWSVAVDGGANVGDWTAVMSERFACVYAFEPAPDAFAALRGRGLSNVVAYQEALFSYDGLGMLVGKKRAGRHVLPGAAISDRLRAVKMVRLDGLALATCGLLKLDLEGAEQFAIRGATATIKRCRPVVIVEDAPELARRYGPLKEIAATMAERGYREAYRSWPDVVFVPGGS